MNRARRFRRRAGSAREATNRKRDEVERVNPGVHNSAQKLVELQNFQEVVGQFGIDGLMMADAMPPSKALPSCTPGGSQ